VNDQGRFYHIGAFKGYRIAHRLAERAVVVGNLSQQQMVIPKYLIFAQISGTMLSTESSAAFRALTD